MKYQDPLRQILSEGRPYWNQDKTRPSVRWAFSKAVQCRTAALGGRVYASEVEQRIFYNPCKTRPCSSCGYRATEQWERERLAALPDVPYKGITFTMPDVLWPLFRDNPCLTRALPALAATVFQVHAGTRYGIRVGVIAILQTFNGYLEFNPHVHTMVTGGGLGGTSNTWVSRVYYDRDLLMRSWRNAVIKLLRAALRAGAGQVRSEMTVEQVEAMLSGQEKRWWSVKIQSSQSKD